MRSIVWNDEIDAVLIQKRAEGKSFLQCQDETGFSAEVLRRRAAALGLPTSRKRRVKSWPPGREEILRRMRAEGALWSEIGSELGLSAKVCARRARNMGIKTDSTIQWTLSLDDRLKCLHAVGLSWADIGKAMSLSPWAVRYRARSLSLVGHKSRRAVQTAPEVGHPPNTAAAFVAASPSQTGGSDADEPIGVASFEAAA